MSGAIINFATTANRLKEAQREKLHKPPLPGPIRKISAPFKALAPELSMEHKKRPESPITDTLAERLDVATEAILTPIRKLSAPLKTLASELSPSDHNNNGRENGLFDSVAQKLDGQRRRWLRKREKQRTLYRKKQRL